MKKESQLKENRQKLKELSNNIKALIKEGVYNTVNEGLTDIYKNEGHQKLKKFWDWKQEGKTVKKGEHALLLWGQPRKGKTKELKEDNTDEYEYYPICYVFSDLQVV